MSQNGFHGKQKETKLLRGKKYIVCVNSWFYMSFDGKNSRRYIAMCNKTFEMTTFHRDSQLKKC